MKKYIEKYPIKVKQLEALIEVASLLNKHDFKWSLGASMMLKLRGIDVFAHDLDLIIKTDEIERLEEVLKLYNMKKELGSTRYPTSYFYELKINNVDLDLMIGFKVKTNDGLFIFDDTTKVDKMIIKETDVYLSSLEEWMKAYHAMGRIEKVMMIQKHLKHH